MYNSDYIPIDQEVIDQAVEEFMKKRNEAKEWIKKELKNAGGNLDIVVFNDARKDYSRFKRIIKALDALGLFWCEVDGGICANRHEVYEVVK